MAMEDLRAAAVALREAVNVVTNLIDAVNNTLTTGDDMGQPTQTYAYQMAAEIQSVVLEAYLTDVDNAYTALAAISVTPIEVPET